MDILKMISVGLENRGESYSFFDETLFEDGIQIKSELDELFLYWRFCMHRSHQQADCYCSERNGYNCTSCNLAHCKVCGGAEASLPTMCPGRRLTREEIDGIQFKGYDFKNDKWVVKS